MENEVLKSPSEFDVSSAIKKWRSQGFSKEMIELARNDMSEYGMPFKQVSIYMDVKLSVGQAEQLSQALRNEVNEDFVRHLAEGGYSAEQINCTQELIDYQLNGSRGCDREECYFGYESACNQ